MRAELKTWVNTRLIDPSQAQELSDLYRLGRLDAEAHGTLMNTVFLVGSALIGCGVVTFVAAHWGAMSVWLKVGVLLGAMLAAHAGGYVLWFWKQREALGQSLVVLGTVMFGANIGLFAQIFHISERFYLGFMAWALGALLVAVALKSVPNAVIAILASGVWFWGEVTDLRVGFLWFPVIVAAVFLPLSYLWRSYLVFMLAMLSIAMAFVVNGLIPTVGPMDVVIAFIVPMLALWCYGTVHRVQGRWSGFGLIAASLGAVGMAGTAYLFSFHEACEELVRRSSSDQLIQAMANPDYLAALSMPLGAVILSAIAAGFRRGARVPRMLVPSLAACAIIGVTLVVRPAEWTTAGFNMIAVAMAAYGIIVGLKGYERRPYWGGLLLAVLLIVSRFFEYESHLMIKAAGFIGAGAALIYAGIKFENRMRRHLEETPHA